MSVIKYDPMDHAEYENVADYFGRERIEWERDEKPEKITFACWT